MFQQAQMMTEGRSISESPVEGVESSPPEEAGVILSAGRGRNNNNSSRFLVRQMPSGY